MFALFTQGILADFHVVLDAEQQDGQRIGSTVFLRLGNILWAPETNVKHLIWVSLWVWLDYTLPAVDDSDDDDGVYCSSQISI